MYSVDQICNTFIYFCTAKNRNSDTNLILILVNLLFIIIIIIIKFNAKSNLKAILHDLLISVLSIIFHNKFFVIFLKIEDNESYICMSCKWQNLQLHFLYQDLGKAHTVLLYMYIGKAVIGSFNFMQS